MQGWSCAGKVVGTCGWECGEERYGNGALPFSGRQPLEQLSCCSLCWMFLSCYIDLVLCSGVSSDCFLEKKGIFLLLDGEVGF